MKEDRMAAARADAEKYSYLRRCNRAQLAQNRQRVTHELVVISHVDAPPRDGHVYVHPEIDQYVRICDSECGGAHTVWGINKSVFSTPNPVIACGDGWLGLQARLFAEQNSFEHVSVIFA